MAAAEEIQPPNLNDDEDEKGPVAGPEEVAKLREELGKVKADKVALEKRLSTAEEASKKTKAELEEAQENVGVYEELVTSFTKKEEADVQEFADLVSEWKGKAKAFDQAKAMMEKSKATEKELADLKGQHEAVKKKVADLEAENKTLKSKPPSVATSGPVPANVQALQADLQQTKTKWEQSKRDAEQRATKIGELEAALKAREKEVAELKAKLATASIANAGPAMVGVEDDPLIEMVEKLLKDMEEMAKESEAYLAQVEKDLPRLSTGEEGSSNEGEKQEEVSSEGPPMPAATKPKPASAAAAAPSTPAKAPTVQQQPQQQPKPTMPAAKK